MKTIFFVLSLVFVILFAEQSLGASCLNYPDGTLLKDGSDCGGVISCSIGSRCDYTGICSTIVADGSSCIFQTDCSEFSKCIGPIGSKICVKNANPGELCSTNSTNVLPFCGGDLTCTFNFTTSTSWCTGAHLGDSCTGINQCLEGSCIGGVCVGSDVYTECNPFSGDAECKPGLYCSLIGFPFFMPNCTTLPDAGMACFASSGNYAECSYGNLCVPKSPTDGNRTCTARSTLTAGQYCGGYNDACQSGVCYLNYCTQSVPDICQTYTDCGQLQGCECSGKYLISGYGKCVKRGCIDQVNAAVECGFKSCGIPSIIGCSGQFWTYASQSATYSGSCLFTQCDTQIQAANKCSPDAICN